MKYELNDNQLKNLLIFMSRVDLKGSEVQAFNEIMISLNSPVQESESN